MRQASVIGAIILAAGSSQRFGGDKRKAALGDGTAVAVQSINNALAIFDEVLVALRHDDRAFSKALEGEITTARRFRTFCAPESNLGMGRSLANAIGQAGDWDGAFVCLADMPFVRTRTLRGLKTALETNPGAIVVPVHEGSRGHPVGFSRPFFDEIGQLTGDRGARPVLARHPDKVIEVQVDDAGVRKDIDTPQDLGMPD